MRFSDYQHLSQKTAIYPNKGNNLPYVVIGLAGETGEVAEKVKKVLRDKDGKIDEKTREEIKGEIGDVLWYLAQVASECGISLEDAAVSNLEKLRSRKERNVIQGSGDNR